MDHIEDSMQVPDLITAGFPCQDLSVAGKRGGLDGKRSGLFWGIIRIAKRLRPRWLLLENVPGFRSSPTGANGRDFTVALAALDELGYGVAWASLDAQWFGLAQRRERVFIVCRLGAPCPPEILFEPEGMSGHSPPCREEGAVVTALSASSVGTCGADDNQDQAGHLVAHTLRGEGFDASEDGTGRGTPLVVAGTLAASGAGTARPAGQCNEADFLVASFKRGQGAAARSIGYRSEQSPTLGATESGTQTPPGIVGQFGVRRLTPRECERLQGFPDDWTQVPFNGRPMSDSARYKMIGNAVAVPVVQWIIRRLAAAGVRTMGELFSGIGGFGLAAEREKIKVLWASEIYTRAQAVYAARFPGVQMLGDVEGLLKGGITNGLK